MSDLMEYKDYYGTVEFSSADNVLFGKVLGVKGLISYEGRSLQDLKNDFEGAIDDYLKICAEEGLVPHREYKGKFNVRVSPEVHKELVLYSAARGKSLNSTVEEAIKNYVMR
jgi:predicted HicB family RNase H-like nuclease